MDFGHPSSDASEVLRHLAGRDVPCPWCDYNLRDAVEARCPECGEPVRLMNLRWSDRRTRQILRPPLAVVAGSFLALIAAETIPPMFFIEPPVPCGLALVLVLALGLGVLFIPWTLLPPRLTRDPEAEVRAFGNVLWVYACAAALAALVVGAPVVVLLVFP